MITYHIYKTDCFCASRVITQSGWDNYSIFIHRPAGHSKTMAIMKNIESKKLSLWGLIISLLKIDRKKVCSFVFHAQSSLPYLMVARLILFCLNDQRTILAYDVHDLHEKGSCPSVWKLVRYGLIRHWILGILEALIFRNQRIRKMTVSEGLAQILAKNYRCSLPKVVRSAPKPYFTGPELAAMKRLDRALLFFGTPERAPVELVNCLGTAGYELHFYGRGITTAMLERQLGSALPNHVKVFGEYSPNELSFISKYKYLLLYKPNNTSLNFRFSLPNKLFQGLNYGTSLIVSSNFEEIIETLSEAPGVVAALSSQGSIEEVIKFIDCQRNDKFWDQVVALSSQFHEKSRRDYMMVTR